jgi:hypothetical protein
LQIEIENNEIKNILSERSRELANIGAFKNMFIGIRKNGGLLLLKYFMVQSGNVAPIFVVNHVVFGFFFGSYCLIATVLNRVPAFVIL